MFGKKQLTKLSEVDNQLHDIFLKLDHINNHIRTVYMELETMNRRISPEKTKVLVWSTGGKKIIKKHAL